MNSEGEREPYEVLVSPRACEFVAEFMQNMAKTDKTGAESLLSRLCSDLRSLEKLPNHKPFYERPYLPYGKYHYILSSGGRFVAIFQIDGAKVLVDEIADSKKYIDTIESSLF
ncbi:MAG: hypothetical protein FWG30_07255 [Eubacteriaceae bacterium]|nr:hypothetical protein [Eubacteriaceae bacterium]